MLSRKLLVVSERFRFARRAATLVRILNPMIVPPYDVCANQYLVFLCPPNTLVSKSQSTKLKIALDMQQRFDWPNQSNKLMIIQNMARVKLERTLKILEVRKNGHKFYKLFFKNDQMEYLRPPKGQIREIKPNFFRRINRSINLKILRTPKTPKHKTTGSNHKMTRLDRLWASNKYSNPISLK